MRILIASGIYPPDLGGPAQYARNLFETWHAQGHDVKVAAYRWERAAPPGLRHLLYFTKVLRKGWNADFILVLDTWSAAVPTMIACALMGKRYVIRTGGDFLWESYVESTGDPVLFKDFYGASREDFMKNRFPKLSRKQRIIFKFGGDALRRAQTVIFSTDWQRKIFERAYGLNHQKTAIVENFCGERLEPLEPDGRRFLGSTRALKWKNADLLKEAFHDAREELKRRGMVDIELDTGKAMYSNFVERMRSSYAVILVSLGDISPNMIYDAIRTGTPFIVTKELGIAEHIRDAALFVDPLDKKNITEKIVWLSDPVNRATQATKVRALPFVHSWEEIAREIVDIWKRPSA